MSGSHWRGALLRIAEAKPRFDVAINAINNPDPGLKAKQIEKKRKRVLLSRGEDVGKEAQDMIIVDVKRAEKKKFWVAVNIENGDTKATRLVRPLCMRAERPIGVVERKESSRRRARLPPARSFRKVINPIQWGSQMVLFSTEEQVAGQNQPEGEWEYEEFEEDEEEETAEDGKVPIGVWKKTVNGEVVQEEVVRAKRRRVEEDNYDIELDLDLGSDDLPAADSAASSPLFRTRQLADREDSPLFPAHEHHTDFSAPTPSQGSVDEPQQPPSPLFSTGPAEHLEQKESSASSSSFASASGSPLQALSPLFSTRTVPEEGQFLTRPSPPLSSASSPILAPIPFPAVKHLPTPPIPAVPAPLVQQVRTEKSAALNVLGSLLDGLDGSASPPMEKLTRNEWKGFSEDDSGEEDVEIGRGKKKEREKRPAEAEVSGVENFKVQEPMIEVSMVEESEKPQDEAENLSSGEESSSNNDETSSNDDKMDVDPSMGNGDEKQSSEESSSSSESGSSDSSGDDDGEDGDNDDSNGDSDDSDDSDSDDSDSDSDSESDDSDSNDSDSDSNSDADSDSDSDSDDSDESPSALSSANPQAPKPTTLKDLFAPAAPSTSLFSGPSTSAAQPTTGFSLLANLAEDLELDDELDIPLPVPGTIATQKEEDELQPLSMMEGGRGKVKLDLESASETPMFFAIPMDKEAAERTKGKKGESRNPFNELHFGVPKPLTEEMEGYGYDQDGYGQNDYGQEQGREEQEFPLMGFHRQPREGEAAMKGLWEKERGELTQAWKRRHREAKKQRRRKGGEDIE